MYSVSRAGFAKHLAWGRTREVRFTFDDGHASHFRHALPLLHEAGAAGLFFITAGWTGVRPECMNWAQLKELSAAGQEIGSHGWTHALLHACSPLTLRDELHRSKQVLEDRLGIPVDSISLPGGRGNQRVLDGCAEQGYTTVYTSDPFDAPGRRDTRVAGRFMVKRHTDEAGLADMLGSLGQPLSLLRIQHRAKRLLRRAIGDAGYQKLWSLAGSSEARTGINKAYGDVVEGREDAA